MSRLSRVLLSLALVLSMAGLSSGGAWGAGSGATQSDVHMFAMPNPVTAVISQKSGSPHWYYTIWFQETNGVAFTIERIDRYVRAAGGPALDDTYDADLVKEWWGTDRIEALSMTSLGSGRPVEDGLDGETWEIVGRDDHGTALSFRCDVAFSPELEDGSGEAVDGDFDTVNLRSRADFAVEVARGVSWVPVASLGGTRYTNDDVAAMLASSPGDKQAAFATLYEALQLFQVGRFGDAEDKIYVTEAGFDWEHHKPGFDAVRTNEGCCATSANWLRYILDGDYPEVGFLAYSQRDGSGHVINYVKADGAYYVIDLTHYRMDFVDHAGIETGDVEDYVSSDYVAGNLHRAESIEDYVRYSLAAFDDPPGLFFAYTADDCLPLDSIQQDGLSVVIYPEGLADVSIVYDDPDDALSYRFVAAPTQYPSFADMPSAAWD